MPYAPKLSDSNEFAPGNEML